MKRINTTYVGTFIVVILFVTTVTYANEFRIAPRRAEGGTVIIKKREAIQLQREDGNAELIINDEVPTYRIDNKYKPKIRKIDIRKAAPIDPENTYSCDDNIIDMINDGEVCARVKKVSPCQIPPCPTEDHWSTYSNAEQACSNIHVIDFAQGRCLNDRNN